MAALLALLQGSPRDARRDLGAIVRCARAFNKERDLGTLEAEELHDALVAIAWGCGILVELDAEIRIVASTHRSPSACDATRSVFSRLVSSI